MTMADDTEVVVLVTIDELRDEIRDLFSTFIDSQDEDDQEETFDIILQSLAAYATENYGSDHTIAKFRHFMHNLEITLRGN